MSKTDTLEMKRVKHGFGTRLNPLPLLNPPRSIEEWDALKPRWHQVHETSVAEVSIAGQECGDVDAFWTREVNLPIAVVSADCVPILLYRRDLKAVAAIHAGWRGIFAGAITRFFESLPQDLNTPQEWDALVGPCIHACCYEVSEELISQFVAKFPEIPRSKIEPTPRKLDLVAVTDAQLKRLGVHLESTSEACTYCATAPADEMHVRDQPQEDLNYLYFSYRRGDRKTRMYAMIGLAES